MPAGAFVLPVAAVPTPAFRSASVGHGMANDKIVPDLLIKSLLDALRRKGVLSAPGVAAAFEAVPRHHFLPDLPLDKVYTDEAIPLKYDHSGLLISSSSQPTMMAIMLDQARLAPGHNVLEVGTATGYNAALMQHIVGPQGHVTTVELEPDLARQAVLNLQRAVMSQVRVVQGDGFLGYAPRAAYDCIMATVGIWDVSPAWLQQLKPEGRLVVPLWVDGIQISAAFTLQPDGTLYSVDNRPCAFVYLRGEGAGPNLRQQVGSTSLYILGDDLGRIDLAGLHLLLSSEHDICYLESRSGPPDYWNGFQLYVMLYEPPEYVFALFAVAEGQQPYGIEGRGMALISRISATFALYQGKGQTHCYGSAESFLAMQELLDEWDAASRPDVQSLRMRLIPVAQGEPAVTQGKVYRRRDHYLHVWLEQSGQR